MISLTLKNYLKIFESHSEFNASLEDFALVFLVFEVSFVASSVIIQSDFLQIFFFKGAMHFSFMFSSCKFASFIGETRAKKKTVVSPSKMVTRDLIKCNIVLVFIHSSRFDALIQQGLTAGAAGFDWP